MRLYEEKTGTSWFNRKRARKVPGKFYPIDIDYGEDEAPEMSLSTAGSNSKLAPEIQDLIKMIFDIETMKKAMMEFEVSEGEHIKYVTEISSKAVMETITTALIFGPLATTHTWNAFMGWFETFFLLTD